MKLNLGFISQYRSSFMGLAIFWIFFYHTGVDISGLRELFALGWMGVDIFFFVSGYGLCRSLINNGSIYEFFKRRFIRIIPTWWLVLAAMAVVGTVWTLKGFPNTAGDYFHWFTGLGWWTTNCNFGWYIPTLMFFYIFSPMLARSHLKTLCWLTLAFMCLAIVFCNYGVFNHIYMSYSRIPIFIFGFMVYKYQEKNGAVPRLLWIPMSVIGLLWFAVGGYIKLSNQILGLTVTRVAIPLFIIPMLAGIAFIFSKIRWINKTLSLLGLISLEVYLLHINHEFSELIKINYLNGMDSYLVKMTWFIIVFAAAWLLHTFMDKSMNRILDK